MDTDVRSVKGKRCRYSYRTEVLYLSYVYINWCFSDTNVEQGVISSWLWRIMEVYRLNRINSWWMDVNLVVWAFFLSS